jgi:glycosyltransferase involved in cell wall biosynthesis
MKLLFVVQRYGDGVVGGSEAACRSLATHLAASGHEVEILTTCAMEHLPWTNVFAPGRDHVDGLVVHRLPVDRPRDLERFVRLNTALLGEADTAPAKEREWLAAQGPSVPGLPGWIRHHAPAFDVVVFFTYLYETTTAGIAEAAARTATVLHPTAHDERYLRLREVSHVFRHADGLAYFTPEEQDLVDKYHAPNGVGRVIGLGFDVVAAGDGDRFRRRHGLGDEPYLLYTGRIEAGKSVHDLIRSARAHHHHRADAPRLVLIGQLGMPVPEEPWLSVVGLTDAADRVDGLGGCLALVQPSRLESFSLSLIEAWQQERPGLVQRRSAALLGQARRSGGAILYSSPSEFAAAVDLLLDEPGLAETLGASGARYVAANYRWEIVIDMYETLLQEAIAHRRKRASRLAAGHALEQWPAGIGSRGGAE